MKNLEKEGVNILPKNKILGDKLANILKPPETFGTSPKILCLIGMPATGKTSIVQALASHLHAELIPEFLEPITSHVRNVRITSPVQDQIAAQRWIIDQYQKKAELVKKLSPGSIIVQDRGIADGIVHSAVYQSEVLETIRTESEAIEWPSALNICLFADIQTIKKRMMKRDGFTEEEFDSNWLSFIYDIEKKYKQICEEACLLSIDTSDKTFNELLTEILSLAKLYLKIE